MMSAAAIRILYVCTANECRSPFAAAITRAHAGTLPLDVDSAGVETWHRGVPATGLQLAGEMGLDLEDHRSRPVHPDFLFDYDVILGMERAHLRELAAIAPESSGRLFTLMQFSRWAAAHPREPGRAVGDWLSGASAGARSRLLSKDEDDDVADPIGRPINEWRHMVERLEPAIDAMVQGMFPAS